MASLNKIIVSIELQHQETEVGELIREGKRIYFKYYSSFLNRKLEISPFKLPLSNQIYSAEEVPFEGLFGVFADSIPDGWGRLLLDRKLTANGISVSNITPLDRLSYVGNTGMGALIYRPSAEINQNKINVIELDDIAKEASQALEGTSSEILERLYSLGGSSGGARPKILVGYNPITQHILSGTNNIPDEYEHWIIKFPASTDPPDVGNIEYAYYKMALDAGIEMSTSALFIGKSGKAYFGTRRFDRKKGEKLHLHSAAGLMHDNFRLSNIDYGHLMDCAFKLENHVQAYEKILRIATFNVFLHNRDDHSKNFSFLMDHTGKWKLAPAYDLIFSNSSHGLHSTTVSGESKNPGEKHLLELADYFKVNKAHKIIQAVKMVASNWRSYLRENGVQKESENKIGNAILLK